MINNKIIVNCCIDPSTHGLGLFNDEGVDMTEGVDIWPFGKGLGTGLGEVEFGERNAGLGEVEFGERNAGLGEVEFNAGLGEDNTGLDTGLGEGEFGVVEFVMVVLDAILTLF